MFRGISIVALDNKGRMALPVRYRELLLENSSSCMLTIDTDFPCLLLYQLNDWIEIEKKLQALPSFHPDSRRVQRLLIGHATDIEIDNHGRVLIPTLLRDYAQLNKRVMLVGQGKKFEVWSEEQWNKFRDQWLAEKGNPTQWPAQLHALSL